MTKTEFNKLKINDIVFFNFPAFDCIGSGWVTGTFTRPNSVYVEIKDLIYEKGTRRYDGHMTLRFDMKDVYMSKEDALKEKEFLNARKDTLATDIEM